LEGGIVDGEWKLGSEFAAEFTGRNDEVRAEEDGSDASV
jgi:hypothetical protein